LTASGNIRDRHPVVNDAGNDWHFETGKNFYRLHNLRIKSKCAVFRNSKKYRTFNKQVINCDDVHSELGERPTQA